MNTTPLESRTQEKLCAKCQRPFWSWGLQRDKCLSCDPIRPDLAKIYREQIDRDDPMVRL